MKLAIGALASFVFSTVFITSSAFSATTNPSKNTQSGIISPETNTVLSPDEFSKKNQEAANQANQKLNQAVENQLAKVPKIKPLPPSGSSDNLPDSPSNSDSNDANKPMPNPAEPAPAKNPTPANPAQSPSPSDSINQNGTSASDHSPTSSGSSTSNTSPWIGKSNSSNSGGNTSSGKQNGWGIRY